MISVNSLNFLDCISDIKSELWKMQRQYQKILTYMLVCYWNRNGLKVVLIRPTVKLSLNH